MRIPNAVHQSQQWRICDITLDFELEDVWALPAYGRLEDFGALVQLMTSSDPAHSTSGATRVLWLVRDRLGRWLNLGRISAPTLSSNGAATKLPIPDTTSTSLADRLPDDLRNTVDGVTFAALPFIPLYRTDTEFAAELSNETVHGVMHLAWVDQGDGRFQGQMAVYVKPRGRLGKAYMAFIRPFRLWAVYPALMRQIDRTWAADGCTKTTPVSSVS
jgi:hypothetical protein